MMRCFLLPISLLLCLGLPGIPALEAQPDSLSTAGRVPMGREVMVDSMLGFHLAPLDTLLTRAIAHSAALHSQEAMIKARASALKVQQRTWMKIVQPYVGVSFGTGTVTANVQDGAEVTYNLATRQQLLYNVGLNVRLTAEDLINRGQRCQILEYEIEKLRSDAKVLERTVAERVIMRYEDLMKSAEVLAIKAHQMHSNAINWELAERYFQSGDMSYADYNGVLNAKLSSQMQFINLKSDFQRHYLLLREVVGGPLR
jgi:outer membrane protein TolC